MMSVSACSGVNDGSAPNPFQYLQGSITRIGVKNQGTIPVDYIAFDDRKREIIRPDIFYLVRSSTDAPQMTLEEAVMRASDSSAASFYGYKYTSVDAALEKQHQNDTLLRDRFPGEFFASDLARNTPAVQQELLAFESQHSLQFKPTGASSDAVTFEPDALYILIVSEDVDQQVTATSGELSLATASSTVQAGDQFTVDLLLSTSRRKVIGVDAIVSYPAALALVSTDTTASVFAEQIAAPSPSGGSVQIMRVRLDDGYAGTEGRIASLTFRALQAGQAVLTINEPQSAVVADAQLLSDVQQLAITVQGASVISTCGDGACAGNETCGACAQDCGCGDDMTCRGEVCRYP